VSYHVDPATDIALRPRLLNHVRLSVLARASLSKHIHSPNILPMHVDNFLRLFPE